MKFENFCEGRLVCWEVLEYLAEHGSDVFQDVADVIKSEGEIMSVDFLTDKYKKYEVKFNGKIYFITYSEWGACKNIEAESPSLVIASSEEDGSVPF